eukprot:6177875-Pleurochrysis_carterae.AAC.1
MGHALLDKKRDGNWGAAVGNKEFWPSRAPKMTKFAEQFRPAQQEVLIAVKDDDCYVDRSGMCRVVQRFTIHTRARQGQSGG